MKKSLLTLTIALCFSGMGLQTIAAPVQAAESQAQRAGRAALVAAYRKQDQALLKKDLPTLMSFAAPDCQWYSVDGQVISRTQAEATMQRGLSDIAPGVAVKFTKVSTRILSLTWRGKDAIVMAQSTSVAVVPPGLAHRRIEQVSLSREYWSPTPQGWKLRQVADRAGKVWVDGQRVL